MRAQIDVGIFFASTGGRTKRVAELIATLLPGSAVGIFDIRCCELKELARPRLLIWGCPTYGTGGMHPHWAKWQARLLSGELKLEKKEVALFVLGDVRHHRETFAGAIHDMSAMVSRLELNTLGYTHAEVPGLGERPTPGLVLDAVTNRGSIPEMVRAWVSQVCSESSINFRD